MMLSEEFTNAPESNKAMNEEMSEEHNRPLVMTEDNAMMLSEEFTNAPESNKAMNEEMSEHDEIVSAHVLKQVLHELVQDAIDKIVKVDQIIGKFKTVHDREASDRDPQCLSVGNFNVGRHSIQNFRLC